MVATPKLTDRTEEKEATEAKRSEGKEWRDAFLLSFHGFGVKRNSDQLNVLVFDLPLHLQQRRLTPIRDSSLNGTHLPGELEQRRYWPQLLPGERDQLLLIVPRLPVYWPLPCPVVALDLDPMSSGPTVRNVQSFSPSFQQSVEPAPRSESHVPSFRVNPELRIQQLLMSLELPPMTNDRESRFQHVS
ncbi:ABC transporter ATP-binding protein [Striga asiatica]|uniref:ABC transporter ATP-binding protein n=1 Tax=Striga asiatica TaxID=4170 RepID=A0A5A7PZ03_STRAF|nr:ABC transporter ATP-binding protein [Striga asiatica]